MAPDDYPEQRAYIRELGIVVPEDLPRGAILGEVSVTDCVEFVDSPWFCGPYAFTLADPQAYPVPVPHRGQLGFFRVDDSLVKG